MEGAVIMAGVDARNVLITMMAETKMELKEAAHVVGDYQWKNVSEKLYV